jgi:hypothetical protein
MKQQYSITEISHPKGTVFVTTDLKTKKRTVSVPVGFFGSDLESIFPNLKRIVKKNHNFTRKVTGNDIPTNDIKSISKKNGKRAVLRDTGLQKIRTKKNHKK